VEVPYLEDSNVLIERAKQLGRELAKTKEYTTLKEARHNLEEHAAAKVMYEDFVKRQEELRQNQMEGKNISEADMESLKKSYEIMMFNPFVRDMLMAEFAFSMLMANIQKAMAEEVGISLPDIPGLSEQE
jgi:cell fate (sporulation/competence/biofilm development) regulator YlbF (YheA/YmcA/DUF963 family)